MSKLFQRVAGFFTNRTMVGMDKAGNRYFAKKDEVDGISKCLSLHSLYSLSVFFIGCYSFCCNFDSWVLFRLC